MKRVSAARSRILTASIMAMIIHGMIMLCSDDSIAVTQAGTEIVNTASSDYAAGSNSYTGSSNNTTVTVNTLSGIDIAPSHEKYLQAGKSINLSHTVTNTGNAADTIDLEVVSSSGFSVKLLKPDGLTALPDSDSDDRPDTGLLSPGESFDFIVSVTAPGGLIPDRPDKTTVTAMSSVSPSVSNEVINSLTILKEKFWDPLSKTVEPEGQVTQGTTVTYTVAFRNAGNITATDVVMTDQLDQNLDYISGSAVEPQGIDGTVVSYNPEEHTISWSMPSISPGYTGNVSFRARIDPDTPSDTEITNSVDLASFQTPEKQSSNSVVTTVVEQALRIRKTADREVAEIGDYVFYSIEIENVSKTLNAGNVIIEDTLPQGFRYLKGSTELDGKSFSDPAVSSTTTWDIGSLDAGSKRILTYRAVVSIDSTLGNGVNTAVVRGKTPGGNSLYAGPATAKVKVREGVLNSKVIILGRVFVDLNRDGMPDGNEPGVDDIRLYLEDGTYAVTDKEGKYSIAGVEAGEHVLKIDPVTVPDGYEAVPVDSSFAGDGGSRFVTVPFGGPARGDFALEPEGNAVKTVLYDSESKPSEHKKYTISAGTAAPVPLEKQIRTMPRTAEILHPENNRKIEKLSSDLVIRVPEEIVYTLKVNGTSIARKRIGKIVHEKRRKLIIYKYIDVPLKAGDNRIVLETESPEGEKKTKEINVHVPGFPDEILISPAKADIPSDGETVVPFDVRLLDKWGGISSRDRIITVITEKGTVLGDDLDPSKPGHQIRTENGRTVLRLRSSLKTGRDRIRVLLGNKLEGNADVYFTPELRDWIIVGIGSYTAGSRDVSGYVENITENDDFEEGVYHDGRLAFFAKGRILGKYLLSAAYESDKNTVDDELFRQVDPKQYYPVYGDASKTGYEAESREKLYVKIEKNRSYAMFGDYRTDLTGNELTRYTRTFNGIKTDINSDWLALKAFGTETNQTVTREELRGNGTSGFYFLDKSPVIKNSEKIVIETRERFHPERIVSKTRKTRYKDYDIDYTRGRILFREPVPSVDDDLNPVFIVVTYESDDPGDNFFIYGGRAGVKPHRNIEIGATAVIEEQDIRDNTLIGTDATLNVGDHTRLQWELAESDNVENGNDGSWKVGFTSGYIDKLFMDLYYRDIGREFSNPFIPGSETGTEKYEASLVYTLDERTHVQGESFVHKNKINSTTLLSNSLGVDRSFGRFSVESGYNFLQETRDGTDRESQIVSAGISGNITEKLGASLRRDQVVTSDEIEDYQTKTGLGVDYGLTEKTHTYLKHEFQEGKRSRDTTLLGVKSRLTEAYTLTSAYRMEKAASGDSAQATIGLNSEWSVSSGLVLKADVERIQEVRGNNGGDSTALAFGTRYRKTEDFRTTGRYELRLGDEETTSLLTLETVSRLNDALSFITELELWKSRKEAGDDVLFDALIGTACRPSGRKSIYLLNSLRAIYEHEESLETEDMTRKLITSNEFTYMLSRHWMLHGKYAGKYTREDITGRKFSSYADMILAGFKYDITGKWDFSFYSKFMNEYETMMHSTGYIIETGYNIYKNVYAGFGYNTSRLNDRDLSGRNYSARGVFMGIRFKFDENTLNSTDGLEKLF